MAKGVVDVYISEDADNDTIILYTDCASGIPHNLNTIRSGTMITLRRENVQSEVKAVQDSDKESGFNYMEISPDNARRFGIKDGMRFVLDYEENGKTLKITRLLACRAYGLLLADTRKNRDDVISIGYALLSWLGISRSDKSITLTKGSLTKKLRLSIPENELDDNFRLSPANLRAFGLLPHKRLKLEYNQVTKTLRILGRNSVAVAKQPSSKSTKSKRS